METTVKPVQNGRGRKRRWPAEQKLSGVAGVEERGSSRRGLPQIQRERRPDVPLEAEPRPRAQGVGRDGSEEPGTGTAEAGREAGASAGTEGLGGGSF